VCNKVSVQCSITCVLVAYIFIYGIDLTTEINVELFSCSISLHFASSNTFVTLDLVCMLSGNVV